MALEGSLTP